MEIQEMKIIWDNMSRKLDEQIVLSEQLINDNAQSKFTKKADLFWNSQIFGFIMAYAIIVLLMVNFHKLSTWLEQSSAVFWMIYLAAMPFYTLSGIKRLKSIDIIKLSYKENLDSLLIAKKRLSTAQTTSMMLNPILFITAAILIAILFFRISIAALIGNSTTILILVVTLIISTLATSWAYKKSNASLSSLQEFIEQAE